MAETKRQPPGTMGLFDALQYRMPAAAIVSILHRASGSLMFVLLPFIVWMLDASVTSEVSYDRFMAVFNGGGWLPGWLVRLVALALLWSFLHHFFAGLRHVWMDVDHKATNNAGRGSAKVVLVVSLALTVLIGARLFGLY
jgi:succinate dehydrogenase / fumarate reductase cytochrome b subunit